MRWRSAASPAGAASRGGAAALGAVAAGGGCTRGVWPGGESCAVASEPSEDATRRATTHKGSRVIELMRPYFSFLLATGPAPALRRRDTIAFQPLFNMTLERPQGVSRVPLN
jgi:hypothetical protein